MTQVLTELQEGPQQLFASLAEEVGQRAGNRTVICLMDGQRSLWFRQRESLPCNPDIGLVSRHGILVGSRLLFRSQRERSSGKVCQPLSEDVVRRQSQKRHIGVQVSQGILKGNRLKTLEKVIGYYRTNRDHMKYDEYLAAGYPIGSGVIEGACRHLVKDRMERSGMRWTIEGATSVLKLRATYLNQHWDQFIEHRIKTEQKLIYAIAA